MTSHCYGITNHLLLLSLLFLNLFIIRHGFHDVVYFCEGFRIFHPLKKTINVSKDYHCGTFRHNSLSSSSIITLYSSSSSSSSSSQQILSSSSIPRNVGTQILQGVGPVSYAQLDQYYIPYKEILKEWTVNIVQKINEQQSKIRLDCQNDTQYFVDDSISITFPRRHKNDGLGFVLTEIAGGRQNIGITIITDIIDDGAYVTSLTDEQQRQQQLMIGDSITSISIIRRQQNLLEQKEQIYKINVEALSYDATIETIKGLYQKVIMTPLADNEQEFYQVSVKRIRRKPKVFVKLQYPPEMKDTKNDTIIELYAGENLRYGMLRRGIQLNDESIQRFDTKFGGNCGANGLCRTCIVSIPKGIGLCNPPRLNEKQILIKQSDISQGRLSCKTVIGYGMKEGNITVRVYPQRW